MDSATMLYRAVATRHDVEAVSFNYGQRHAKELNEIYRTVPVELDT